MNFNNRREWTITSSKDNGLTVRTWGAGEFGVGSTPLAADTQTRVTIQSAPDSDSYFGQFELTRTYRITAAPAIGKIAVFKIIASQEGDESILTVYGTSDSNSSYTLVMEGQVRKNTSTNSGSMWFKWNGAGGSGTNFTIQKMAWNANYVYIDRSCSPSGCSASNAKYNRNSTTNIVTRYGLYDKATGSRYDFAEGTTAPSFDYNSKTFTYYGHGFLIGPYNESTGTYYGLAPEETIPNGHEVTINSTTYVVKWLQVTELLNTTTDNTSDLEAIVSAMNTDISDADMPALQFDINGTQPSGGEVCILDGKLVNPAGIPVRDVSEAKCQ